MDAVVFTVCSAKCRKCFYEFLLFYRMEVQADVQKERCSLSGESATVSLGTISDNASTKAMAGSILNAYMTLERLVFRRHAAADKPGA